MNRILLTLLSLFLALPAVGCGSSGTDGPASLVVNSLSDLADPPEGTVTLRAALAAAASGQRITFAPHLDGGVIELSRVDAEHTVLKGEVMGIRDEPSGPVSYLVGWFERDYGRSALYARKDVGIDAASLPSGITLAWVGGKDDDARLLAVYGDLFLRNVTVEGGRSTTVELVVTDPDDQPWTLARGGGVAVWGRARLLDCRLYDNHCTGDFDSSRDRGAFGGGIYANLLDLRDCVVCGNTVLGAGAAGGGAFSVGGAEEEVAVSNITRCAISGNRIAGLFAYGAGVYSDGGGIGKAHLIEVVNSTLARNAVEPPPGVPGFLLGIGYWRGGGFYMSNGYGRIHGCTVVENEVTGLPRTDSLGRANLAGGIAATIGNAHAVEEMILGHSILCGNVVNELGFDGKVARSYPHDVFTGSVLYFRSLGHNRIGVLDFNQILVPVGNANWRSLCRRHYPKEGDRDDVELADVVDLIGGVETADGMMSAGVDEGEPAPVSYLPRGSAVDQIPDSAYPVTEVIAEYDIDDGATNDFLAIVLARLEDHYGLAGFAASFQADFEAFLQSVDLDENQPGNQPYERSTGQPILTLADTQFFGPARTWPQQLENHPYIHFWHRLDEALRDEGIPGLGPEVLGDEEWSTLFSSGRLDENGAILMSVADQLGETVRPLDEDQSGASRPASSACDVGAIEAR